MLCNSSGPAPNPPVDEFATLLTAYPELFVHKTVTDYLEHVHIGPPSGFFRHDTAQTVMLSVLYAGYLVRKAEWTVRDDVLVCNLIAGVRMNPERAAVPPVTSGAPV